MKNILQAASRMLQVASYRLKTCRLHIPIPPAAFRRFFYFHADKNSVWQYRLLLLLYFLIVFGAIDRIVYVFELNPVDHIWSDTQRHWDQGVDVLRKDPMAMTDPILYQIYMGVLAKLTLKFPLLVAFYTALLSVLMPWIWYRFFRELQPSKPVAVAGWAAISWLPSWHGIYGYFMQETLMLPLLGAALYFTWRCKRKQDAGSFIAMVLLWILAGLTRGICIPLAAVCCTWLWLVQDKKIIKAGLSLLLLGFLLGPLAYRSYKAVNFIAPHGIGYLAALYAQSGKKEIHIAFNNAGTKWRYWFGSPSTGAKPFAPFSDWATQRTGRIDVRIDMVKGKADWKRAFADNNMDWERCAWITKENLVFLFFGPSWPDTNLNRRIEKANYHLRWIWAPLTLAVLIWSAIWRRRLRGQRMLLSLIAVWFVVQGLLPIAVNEGRYRKPLEGLLLAQIALLLGTRKSAAKTVAGPGRDFQRWLSMEAGHLRTYGHN